MSINFREEIKNLQPYKPGKPISDVQREYGLDHIIKLASNENPLGCSEKVKEAIKNSLNDLSIYPDGNATELKEELSKSLGVKPNEILPTSGLDEMIDLIAKSYVDKGDEVIMADLTFPRYIQTTEMMGGVPVIVPLKDFTFDLDGILNKITDKTKVIWICNPNNPTGTIVTERQMVEFFKQVPSNIMVVYDEAYKEYVTSEEYPHDSIKFLKDYPNLLIMRTFSKVYGLAGLRVGYTIGNSQILENINKVRGPFNVSSLGLAAGVAALKDIDFIKKSYDLNVEGRNYLYEQFDKMKFYYPKSETNHIFVNVEKNGQEIFMELQKKGVIIRPMGGNFIRVSIGTMEENKIFIEKLKEVLRK